MKYVILIHSNPQPWGHPTGDYVAENLALPADQRAAMNADFEALLTEISERGELVAAEALGDPGELDALPLGDREAAGDRRSLPGGQGALGRFLPGRRRDPERAQELARRFSGPGETIELRPTMWPGGDDQ